MIPRLSPWLIPLLVPMAMWHRVRGSPFLVHVLSSYALQFLRVLNWAIASALVYRWDGEIALAAFSLARAIVLVFQYAAVGAAPALVTLLPQMSAEPVQSNPPSTGVLDYSTSPSKVPPPANVLMWRTGLWVSIIPFLVLGIAMLATGLASDHQLVPTGRFWSYFGVFAAMFAFGTCLRLFGDACGARLQVEKRIGTDNALQLIGEALWLPLTIMLAALQLYRNNSDGISATADSELLGSAYMSVSILVALPRWWFAQRYDRRYLRPFFRLSYARLIIASGFAILLGQVAEFLYAPANQLLIKYWLDEQQLAAYAPTLFVDGALLLLVSGLSTVLFPYTATAFHHQKWNDLRFYYVFGTIFSLVILTVGAVVVCLIDGWLFTKWFGDPLPATQAILPLVMIHTVVGGSASIGRSVLFGMNRIKPYALSAILGGVANVGLAILFLTTTDLGLKGIILATVITVTLRCLIWLPIYTMWSIRKVGGPMRFHWH